MKLSSIVTGDISSADSAAPKNTFFKLTPEISSRLITCDLSKSEMKLWLYLVAIAPFGDRQYAYSAPEAMLACGLKKSTYFLCKSNLQKLGLIDFRDGETKFINKLAPVGSSNETKLSGEKIVQKIGQSSTEKIVQKIGLQSKNLDSSPKNWTRLQKIGLPETETRSGQGVDSLQTIQINFRSSSDPEEEEFEILNKKVDQGSGIEPEDTSKPESVGESEDMSTPESLTTLVDKEELVGQPEKPGVDHFSAAPPPKNEAVDQELLKWLVEVKIPSLELDDPPRNLEAYARGMIRRDGDSLRAEFDEVLGDRQFQSRCAELTEKVEARAGEWRKVGIPLTVFWDLGGMPAVMLNGSAIAANDFLSKPIEQPTTNRVTGFNRENSENRKARQSRLRCADMLGECPGIEFLIECWGDVVLQPQVKALIVKYPEWGVSVEQLRESAT